MDQIQNYQSLSISLPADLVRMIQEKVEDGLYASRDNMIEVALRSMQEDDVGLSSHEIDLKLKEGLESVARGDVLNLEDVIAAFKGRSSE